MDLSLYKDFLKTEYPSAYSFLKKTPWTPPFFPDAIPLDYKHYLQMEKVVKNLFQFKSQADYLDKISKSDFPFASLAQKQDSVLMAYDFHIDAQGMVKLIEVNTNASAFLLVNFLYQFQGKDYQKAKEGLKQSFQSEWKKFQHGKAENENTRLLEPDLPAPKNTVLIDENILNQKMVLEFFMYKDFFKSLAWPFKIEEAKKLKADQKGFLYDSEASPIDFVYNRTTDFYFEKYPSLKKAFVKKTCAISPQPGEYYLLSDKERLCDWSLKKELEPKLKEIKQHLLFSESLTLENKERIWKNKKKYFFKNKKSYGGKQAYKGSNLSRKKFESLCLSQTLVQEFCPPSKTTDTKGQEWKLDFRAYVYEDQIQQLSARCYHGQVTNFQTEGSGFATVKIV